MKRGSAAAVSLFCAGLGLAGTGCHVDKDPGAEGRPRQMLEIFSWWSAPGEAEALEALIDVHRAAHPGVRIFNSAATSGANARELLDGRLGRDDPPDLFQEYVHALRPTEKYGLGRRQMLDDMFDQLGLRQVMFPEVVRDVTKDGHIFAMPVNLHRENTLFYNRRIFAAHNLLPPTTLGDFLKACKILKAAGVTPVVTSYEGWILRIMFNSLAAGKMGAVRFHDYFTGHGPADLPLLREVIALFADVLETYTNADAGEEGFTWTTAAQAVYNGDAAMYLHGDWVKGYFVQLGWIPDVDFGAAAAPGTGDLFLYGVDAFALPQGAHNPIGAREFLITVASTAGQVAFNRLKGSTPIRRDVPRAGLDGQGRATLDDLEHARVRMLVHSPPVWEDALAAFARSKSRDREALLQTLVDSPLSP